MVLASVPLALASIAIGTTALIVESYTYTYLVIVSFLLVQIFAFNNITHRLVAGIFLAYLSIALLNISSYRNYISSETINIYLVFVLCLFIPIMIVSGGGGKDQYEYRPGRLTGIFIVGHLAITWVALAYVYSRFGIVAVEQDERFGIPTAISYIIRSAQFIPAYMVICRSLREFPLGFWPITFLSIAPSILIASRSTAVLAVLAIVLIILALEDYRWVKPSFASSPSLKPRSTAPLLLMILGVASITFIGGGFYVRRASSPQLIDGTEFVQEYLQSLPAAVAYVLAPFHQGFNEASALTSRIVDYGIENTFTGIPLLWADFANLLGTDTTSAAQYFGDSIGRTQAGGLTPGLVGGVLLDFPTTYALWFLGIGILSAILFLKSRYDRRFLCIYAIFVTQLVHLFQRGFLKPEYLTIMLIAAVYLATFEREPRSG
uniref:Oligosaccharide repeat unit polymerase n=1 Tax=Mycobacterium sp. (strain JLS) TaxID=164757 RepID=A0A5Q5CC61_MYCSJ